MNYNSLSKSAIGAVLILNIFTSRASADGLDPWTNAANELAEAAQKGELNDIFSDLVKVLERAVDLINSTVTLYGPQLTTFMNQTENFYPKATQFASSFETTVNIYGPSVQNFLTSFVSLAGTVQNQAPAMVPKLIEAAKAVAEIGELLKKNEDPFMSDFGSASQAIASISKPQFIVGTLVGTISTLWAMNLCKPYIFTLNPEKSIPIRIFNKCRVLWNPALLPTDRKDSDGEGITLNLMPQN